MQERGNSEAIRLAQASDWKGLQRLLERKPAVAKERGDHGMLPIHWVCTVRRVPLTLVSKLLQAYPDGVKAKNAGELLPLHIAIRAHVHASILRKLVRAYPDAVNEHTPDGVSALELAEQVALDAESLKVLYRALDRNSLVQQQPDDDGNNSFSRENVDFNYDISNNDDSISQEKGQDSGVETPENKDDENDENWGTPLESTPKPFVGNAVFGEEYFHHSVENDDFDAAKLSVLEPDDSISMLSEQHSVSDDEVLDSPHDHLVSPSSTSTCNSPEEEINTGTSRSSSRSSFTTRLGAGIRAFNDLPRTSTGIRQKARPNRIHRTVSLLEQLQSNGVLTERELRTMVSAMSDSAATEELNTRSSQRNHNRNLSLPLMPSYENLRRTTGNNPFHVYSEADDENESSRGSGSTGIADTMDSFTRGRMFLSAHQPSASRRSTTPAGGSQRGSPPILRRSQRRASHGSHSRRHFETPPEWKHDGECSICRASFGVFKHRHHCRNCGKSICSQHSADKKLIMEDKGFTTPQRVCVTCYAMITHSRSLRHDLEIDDYGREGATAAPAAFQQQYYGGGNGEQHAFASRTRSVRSPARPERGSQAGSPTPSTGTARNVNSRKSSLVAAGEATGGAGERATTANHASGIPAVSGGQAATVQELRCLLASQQKQIEQLAQSNMQMQQQLIEQEELKAETMLLITQLMTRVSVLELHKDNSLRTTKRRSVGTGDSEDDEEYPQDDTTAFMR